MAILYLHTAPPPAIAQTDAVFNEVEVLRNYFGGEQVSLFPFLRPNSHIPRAWYGWHRWRKLLALQKNVSLIHVFSPRLYYYPVLSILKKPIIYSVTAAIGSADLDHRPAALKALSQIVVSNPRDAEILHQKSFEKVVLIKPGLDLSTFRFHWLPTGDQFHLLMASAPWEAAQFESKGVNLLLDAVSSLPRLRLTLLWRGIHFTMLQAKIRERALEDRVQVINERVEVNQILETVHATILLARTSDLVKAYPHSLIESLAMGKPVIISSAIAMSDYVAENSCGIVLQEFHLTLLKDVLLKLEKEYSRYCEQTKNLNALDFDKTRMLSEMEHLYRKLT